MDETRSVPDAPREAEQPGQPTVVVAGTVAMGELRVFFDRAFGELGRLMSEGAFEPSGPPLALYRGVPAETVHLEVGFPVRGDPTLSGSVLTSSLPATRVVTCVHRGDYDSLGESWQRLADWAGRRGLSLGELMWELYVTEPMPGGDPADMVTELYWSLRA